jgi:hypothetical protein
MPRYWICLIGLLSSCPVLRGDTYDRYTNTVLARLPGLPEAKAVEKVTPQSVAEQGQLFPESGAALVIVRTNTGNNAKLLVQFARQKSDAGQTPMALLERATTYKPGQERALQAFVPVVHLYDGFQLNLDLGQVVPAKVGGDLRYVETADGGRLEPVKNAKLFVVTRHPHEAQAKKPAARSGLGEAFDPQAMTGTYQLRDDGRRKAALELAVDAEGNVTGGYTSEQSGRKYEVAGKVTPTMKHQVVFTVKFPNSSQEFTGFAFTKDAGAICGTTRFQGQEFGFYAVREK